ncbi:chromodomain-helicase-DNA-binding protein 1-like isoform X1 [Tachysurus ichikawai]
MVLKGLPESFKPFAIHVAHTDDKITFAEFKTKLRNFEETEKIKATESSDSVMKTQGKAGWRPAKTSTRDWSKDDAEIVCFKCGTKGHRARGCRQKVWCSICKRDTHKDATCRRKDIKDKKDGASKASDDVEDYAFKMRDRETGVQRQPTCSIQEKGLMVDTGATSHIITDITMFKRFDSTFRPETHSVELADGTRCNGVAQRRGNAEVSLIDSRDRNARRCLKTLCLYRHTPKASFQ